MIPKASNAESKVFYLKMKGDYYRYLAEVATGDARNSMYINWYYLLFIYIYLSLIEKYPFFIVSDLIHNAIRIWCYCLFWVCSFLIIFSCSWWFTEGISRCVWNLESKDDTYTPNKARSSTQLFSLLLWNFKFTREGLPVSQTGHCLFFF